MAVGALVVGWSGSAGSAPGQCRVTGYGTFPCDLEMDGAGLTFALPDGQSFAFALVEEGKGVGYLIAADARPGAPPKELGTFSPIDFEDGCWMSARDEAFQFCAAVAQEEAR